MAATDKASKPNLFAKAKGKTAETPVTTSKKKETVWSVLPTVTDKATADQLDEAVGKVVSLQAEAKAIDTQQKVYKRLLQGFANEQFVTHIARTGVEPASPLKVSNSKGETVTFVVQDRGAATKVTDEMLAGLTQLLGEDGAEKVIWTGGEFKFNTEVMSQQDASGEGTVMDAVAEIVSAGLSKAVEKGRLTQDQVDALLEYKEERRLKPGMVERAAEICGRDKARIESFLDLLAGGCVRYVKA
jgi:hypothetical protein